ncbi:hypothetical protein K5D36_24735 [Pseudomonas cichorii]|nr:hypothetical protein [Pseudomonas cichorii]
MNIYRSLILLAVLLCAACAKTPRVPQAELTLLSFERGPNNFYIVDFTSNINLLTAFQDYENSNQLPPMLICSLNRDTKFSADHAIAIKAEGVVKAKKESKLNHNYIASLIFYYTNPDGTQRNDNDYDAIKPLLLAQDSIPCKARITYYGFKAYYSDTLLIPTELMLKKLE